jgi:hypothetical protein
MDEYIARTGMHPYQYKKNKKRTIEAILSGKSTLIKTINEWNISWDDFLDSDTSKIKDNIKNYLISKKRQDSLNTRVYFNNKLNIYHKKVEIYGHEKASLYISNIFYNLSKHNKLDWLNDIDIVGIINPITRIGKDKYSVTVCENTIETMCLDEIETIAIVIMGESMRECLKIEIDNRLKCFVPNIDDHFFGLYNGLMKTNPHYLIENLKLPKYKASNKCKIGTQKIE